MPLPTDRIADGEHLAQEGRLDEAATLFEALLETEPNNPDALNNLGAVAIQLQDYEKGLKALLRGFCLRPENDILRENVEILLNEASLRQEAAEQLKHLAADQRLPTDARQRASILGEKVNGHNSDQIPRPEVPGPFFRPPGKKRLLFLEQRGLSTGGFLDHIIEETKTTYDTQHVLTTDIHEARRAIDNADVIWLEWAGPLTAAVTQQVAAVRYKPVICRIHGFEVFTESPGQVNWNVVDRLAFVAGHKQALFNRRWPNAGVAQLVVRNGIDLNQYSVPVRKQNTKNLLLLGHLNYRKGIPMLLQFYHELLKRDSAFHLYVRGSWQDARYQMAAMTMIEELALTDKVTFVESWIDDLNLWMADKSHILSFSLEESFHYAIGNGMAAGLKPVIHAWNESRSIWPGEFIFRDLDEFLALMLDDQYEPESYRAHLLDRDLTTTRQLAEIRSVLAEIEMAYATERSAQL